MTMKIKLIGLRLSMHPADNLRDERSSVCAMSKITDPNTEP